MLKKIALALLFFATAMFALEGKVVKVSDGDTITVLDDNKVQHKVRFYGIDAPEKSQPYGEKSRKNLESYVAGKYVKVDTRATDRYGRTVGVVYAGNTNVNEAQVADGYAWAYTQYGGREFKTFENDAKSKGLGLWADKKPQAPWEYRKNKKNKTSTVEQDDDDLLVDLLKAIFK